MELGVWSTPLSISPLLETPICLHMSLKTLDIETPR